MGPASAIRATAAAGVRLGADYPRPILDLDEGRAQALRAFAAIRGETDQRTPATRKNAKKSG